VDDAIFDYADGTEFDLMALEGHTAYLLALLREVEPRQGPGRSRGPSPVCSLRVA
jgi:hypothetical protein